MQKAHLAESRSVSAGELGGVRGKKDGSRGRRRGTASGAERKPAALDRGTEKSGGRWWQVQLEWEASWAHEKFGF